MIYYIISVLQFVVNYDADGKKSTILDVLKNSNSIKELSDGSKRYIEYVNDMVSSNKLLGADLSVNSKLYEGVDSQIVKMSKSLQQGKITQDQFNQSVTASSKSTFTFSNAFKSVAANMAIMLAVSVAIKLAVKAWDELNTTTEEYKETVDNTKSKLEEYKNELAEIQKDGVSDSEKEREEYLKRMINWYDEMYDSQMKSYYASQLFGKGDFMSGGIVGDNQQQYLDYSDVSNQLDDIIKKRDEINNKIENETTSAFAEYNSDGTVKNDDKFRKELQTSLEQNEKDLENYKTKLQDQLTTWYEDREKYQNALDSGLFTGSDKSRAEKELSNLQNYISFAENDLDKINVQLGITVDKDEVKAALSSAIDEPIEVPIETRIADMDTVKEDLSKIQDVFKDIKNGGAFDLNLLANDDFKNTFSDFDSEYSNFLNTMSDGNSTIDQQKSALNELVSAYLDSSKGLENLSDSEKNLVTKMLEASGVANAQEVVNRKLAQAKLQNLASTGQLVNMTNQEIAALLQENYGLQINEQLLQAVALAKQTVNGTTLNFSNDINNIMNLVKGLGGATASLAMLADAKQYVESGSGHWSGMSDVAAKAKQEVQDAINSAMDIKVNFSGVPSLNKKSGSSSKVDPYSAEIDALRDYITAYEDAQHKREELDKKYDNASTNEEKLALAQERINAYIAEQEAIEALNDARDVEIQKNVEELRSQGFKVAYDPTTDKLHISNLEHLNKLKGSNQEKTNKLIQDTEQLIKTTQDMADANSDLADTWQDNVYNIKEYREDVKKLKQELVTAKIDNLNFLIDMLGDAEGNESVAISHYTNIANEAYKALTEALADGLDYTDSYVQTLLKAIQSAADGINKLNVQVFEKEKDTNDSILKGVNSIIDRKIKLLEKEKSELEKINDENKRALELSQLQIALKKAEESNTLMVYRKETGWGYEANQDDIKEAKQNLAEFKNEQQIQAIQDEIDSWQDYLDKWNEIPTEYENAQNELIAEQELGRDLEKQISDQRIDIVENFADRYTTTMENLKVAQEQSTEDMLKMLGVYENYFQAMESYQSKHYYANLDGNAPSSAKIGDYIHTNGGIYQIVAPGTEGANENSTTGLWSKYIGKATDKVTEANQGMEILSNSVDSTTKASNTVSTGLNTNSYANNDNTDSTEDNTKSVDNLSDNVDKLADELPVIGSMDGKTSGGNNNSPNIDDSVDGMWKEYERRKANGAAQETLDAIKAYINSMSNANSSSVSNTSLAKLSSAVSSAVSNGFEDYKQSLGVKPIGNGRYEYVEDGKKKMTDESRLKYQYADIISGGYTDREQASSYLQAMELLGLTEDYKENYYNSYVRKLITENTPKGVSSADARKAYDDTKRAIQEILDSKNGVSNSYGSYDSTGNKVTSVSVDRNGNVVNKGYSENATDLSDLVDSINEMPTEKEILKSDAFNKILSDIIDPNNKYYEDTGNFEDVDKIRAYDSSDNNIYDSLRLETQKNGEEVKSNSQRLAESEQAINALADEFGEGTLQLKDAANNVVEVMDSLGNTIGTINTQTGSVYRGGSSGNSLSSSITNPNVSSAVGSALGTVIGSALGGGIGAGIGSAIGSIASGAIKNATSSFKTSSGHSGTKTTNGSGNTVSVTVKHSNKKGSRYISKDMFSALDEDGDEFVIRNSYGGNIGYLREADAVATKEEKDTFFNFVDNPSDFIKKTIDESDFDFTKMIVPNLNITVPDYSKIVPHNNNSVVNHFDKLELPNVTNGEQFIKELEQLNYLPQLASQRANSNLK